MEMEILREKYKGLSPVLTERSRRLWAATEAKALGHGGIALVERATGVSRSTIQRGLRELEAGEPLSSDRERRSGGGRKPTTEKDPTLLTDLDALVEPTELGDPDSPLRWTVKSVRTLSAALQAQGHGVSHNWVAELLHDLGYSLQLNQKMLQVGKPHPDRDGQFRKINEMAKGFMAEGIPVISIDCKKKELVGNFKNQGGEYAKSGQPIKVLDHDFPLPELGKVAPYGIYDIASNEGFINLGISSDTARFAVNSIREWWNEMGAAKYTTADKLYITADGGGSNGSRNRLWKTELQEFANETGLQIYVSHFPRFYLHPAQ